MAALKGIASKTAASTNLLPLCSIGSPATTGTVALALKHSLRSVSLLKFSRMTGWRVSKQEATTCNNDRSDSATANDLTKVLDFYVATQGDVDKEALCPLAACKNMLCDIQP